MDGFSSDSLSTFFSCWPPLSITGNPSLIDTVPLAERYLILCPNLYRSVIIISSACGGIGDLEMVWTRLSIWKSQLAQGRAAPHIQPDQSGLNWATDVFTRRALSVRSAEGLKNLKYLIYFMAGYWGEKHLKSQMMKRERRKKKDLYHPLSMDTIIESCLILMVLLLRTCARHLIVDCTALKSPIYLVTISGRCH